MRFWPRGFIRRHEALCVFVVTCLITTWYRLSTKTYSAAQRETRDDGQSSFYQHEDLPHESTDLLKALEEPHKHDLPSSNNMNNDQLDAHEESNLLKDGFQDVIHLDAGRISTDIVEAPRDDVSALDTGDTQVETQQKQRFLEGVADQFNSKDTLHSTPVDSQEQQKAAVGLRDFHGKGTKSHTPEEYLLHHFPLTRFSFDVTSKKVESFNVVRKLLSVHDNSVSLTYDTK